MTWEKQKKNPNTFAFAGNCRKIKQSKIKDLKVIGNTLLVHDYLGDKCF